MSREIPREELPPNSWQQQAHARGMVFYGGSRTDIAQLEQKVAEIEAAKASRAVPDDNVSCNVGRIVMLHAIINGTPSQQTDRYAHMAPTD